MTTTIDHTRMHDWSADAFRSAFTGKTATTNRPTAALHPTMHPSVLERVQAGWDAAKDADTTLAAYVATVDQKKAAQRAVEEEQHARDRQRAEDQWLEPAKRAYLHHGGTEEGWQRDRDRIAEQARHQAAAAAIPVERVQSLVNVRSL